MPKWRKDSVFGTGPRVPLDREQRAVFRAKLMLNRRPGRLTISAAAIGRIMLDMMGQDGRLDPCHATLATLARVDVATVKRALERLQACGFIEWTRRLVRSAATGWRVEQTSNAYVLRVPATEAHFARPVKNLRFKKQAANSDTSWQMQCERAAAGLRALGFPIPAEWGLT